MKKLVLFYMLFFGTACFAFPYPIVSIFFNNSPPTTVFYGETLRIPVQMNYANLRVHKQWTMPAGSSLEIVSGTCPSIPYDSGTYWSGTCNMDIVIQGNSFEKIIQGSLKYHVFGKDAHEPDKHTWDNWFYSPNFFVTVIPHNLSMLPIPIQEGTANQSFIYSLRSAVKFYDENIASGNPIQGIVTPIEQDGLRFDQSSFSIVGTPNRTGTYHFNVSAQNANGTAASTDFNIQIHVNVKDKPVFKKNPPVISATPGEKYSINLLDLIEQQTGFMVSNQISFRIDLRQSKPDWLHISQEDVPRLVGDVPLNAAGQQVEVTLIASSNTGGDSEPLKVKIPVVYDPTKKPQIEAFELEKLVGTNIHEDLSSYIKDPAHDANLKVILEKVEPAAPWLSISSLHPTVLEGIAPDAATGQKYQLTLRANTPVGGSSEPVIIPLQIHINKEQTPQFKSASPLIPMLYPGQPFFYDFVGNKDINPEYNDAPYEIKFAEGFNPPSWLRIEENKLISDLVPEDIDYEIIIEIVIKNIPGGSSGVIQLILSAMD